MQKQRKLATGQNTSDLREASRGTKRVYKVHAKMLKHVTPPATHTKDDEQGGPSGVASGQVETTKYVVFR